MVGTWHVSCWGILAWAQPWWWQLLCIDRHSTFHILCGILWTQGFKIHSFYYHIIWPFLRGLEQTSCSATLATATFFLGVLWKYEILMYEIISSVSKTSGISNVPHLNHLIKNSNKSPNQNKLDPFPVFSKHIKHYHNPGSSWWGLILRTIFAREALHLLERFTHIFWQTCYSRPRE